MRKILPLFIFLSFCAGQNYQELFQQGYQLRVKGDYAGALSFFQKAREKQETAEVLKEIGNVYYLGERDLAKAESFYRDSMKKDPKYINAIHNLGMIKIRQYEDSLNDKGKGNEDLLKEAKSWLDKAVAMDPKFFLSYTEMGNYYFYKKKYDSAIKILEKSIELNREEPTTYSVLGEVYYKGKKDLKKALDSLETSYSLSAQIPDTLYLLAKVNRELKKKKAAHSYYLKYLESLKLAKVSKKVLARAEAEKSQF